LEETGLFQQVTNLLRALAQEQPLLLLLDDLQWVDSASAGLLFHLGRRLAGSRVFIAGAYRPEEIISRTVGSHHPRSIPHPLRQALAELQRQFGDISLDLAGIPESEGHRFVDSLLDTEANHLEQDFRAALYTHTGGHPLFTVELLRTMQQRGDVLQDETGTWIQGPALHWDTLPPRVEGIIQARVGRLDRELRELLSVASVEGETFTAQVLARVQGLGDRQVLRLLSRDLEDRHHLVREHSLSSEGSQWLARYRFSHSLFQQYLYQRLGEGERVTLHGEVAKALEELYRGRLEEVAALLAHHCAQSHDRERALHYFTLAGDVALAAYASREAEEHYRRALDLEPAAAEEADLLSGLGEALARQNHLQEAMAVWRDGLERYRALEDGDAVARLYARSAWAAAQAGDQAEHLRLCLEGLNRAGEAPDGPGRATLLNQIAMAYMDQAQREEGEPFARLALEMAERLGHVELQALTLTTWSALPHLPLEESIALATRAVALAEENGLLLAGQRAHTFLAHRLSVRVGRSDARRHYRRGAELARQGGLVAEQGAILATLTNDLMRSGLFVEAEEILREARRLLKDLDETASATARIDNADMHRMFFLGQWAACADRARAVMALRRKRGATAETGDAAMWLGLATVESLRFRPGSPTGAWKEAERALAEATEVFDRSLSEAVGIITRGAWANLCLLQGQLADAQRLLVEVNEVAEERAYPPWIEGRRLWLAAQVAAAVGDRAGAMEHYEETCELLARSSICWLRARILLDWAEAHASRGEPGDRQRAGELLREARMAFQNMGVPVYAAIAQERLQELES
jgi:tetratricopeptide (TPR) repeat protein